MGYDTKPNLSSQKFEQRSGDTLVLSGITNFSVAGGADLRVDNVSIIGKPIGGNGLTRSGSTIVLGGTLTGATLINLVANDLTFSATTATLKYLDDYSVNYVPRSIPDVGYVTGLTSTLSGVTFAGNGLSKSGNTIVLGGTLTGDTLIDTSTFNFALGNNASATGTTSIAIGYGSKSHGASSISLGRYASACGDNSNAFGYLSSAIGLGSLAGAGGIASGSTSLALVQATAYQTDGIAIGRNAVASGNTSVAIGYATFANNTNSVSIGSAVNSARALIACGIGSVNVSHMIKNTGAFGLGALANYSTIIGGRDNNIAIGNTGATLIGGDNLDLTGTTYIDTTAVVNLAILTIPQVGATDDTVLVRNASTGVIKYVTQASISGVTVTANNGLTKSGSNITLGGTLTGNTDVLSTTNAITLSGTTGSVGIGNTANSITIDSQILIRTLGSIINSIEFSPTNIKITDGRVGMNAVGAVYAADYSANFIPRSLVDKGYVTGITSTLSAVTFAGNGLTKQGNTIVLGGTLTGNTIIDTNDFGVVIGSGSTASGINSIAFGRGTQACADNSVAFGSETIASGSTSHAEGNQTIAYNTYSHAEGNITKAFGTISHAEGQQTCAIGCVSHAEGYLSKAFGIASHAEGQQTTAIGLQSHAEGQKTCAIGDASHTGGRGETNKEILATGSTSFNHSENNTNQTIGHGALANNSAILGGRNHNIEISNTGATIIGGDIIKLTGSSYIDTTAVANLAIMTTPQAGASGDTVLVRNASTGVIKYVTQASFGGSGATLTANNGIIKSGADNLYLGGTLTGNTTISQGTNILTITGTSGSAKINTTSVDSKLGYQVSGVTIFDAGLNINSLQIGQTASATGSTAIAIGYQTKAFGATAIGIGNTANARCGLSIAIGCAAKAYAGNTIAIGPGSNVYGNISIAIGKDSKTCGDDSIAMGTTSYAKSSQGIAIGKQSSATGTSSIAIGYQTNSNTSYSIAFGRTAKAIGSWGIAIGYSAKACGNCSIAMGGTSTATGTSSIAIGHQANANAINSIGIGKTAIATGTSSIGIGNTASATGASSIAIGCAAKAFGTCSIAIGSAVNLTRSLIASGVGSVNISNMIINTGPSGLGALANYSAILGGRDNNIEVGNTGATIIGGINLNLTGTSYIDTTAVANLAIMTTPQAGASGDTVLVRNASTGVIKYVTQASFGGSGATLTANNGIIKSGADNLYLGGTLTGNTIIDTNSFGVVIGSGSTASGINSIAFGSGTTATAINSTAFGEGTCATGRSSHAQGKISYAFGDYSHAHGLCTCALGNTSHAEGYKTIAKGIISHAEGFCGYALGETSHVEGLSTCAIGSQSHAEGLSSHASGNSSHAQNDGTRAIGNQSHSGGKGSTSKKIIASGITSFNHSENFEDQTTNHGAIANNSAILGGINHNIEVGNTGATIIGGNAIKLTGSTYINTTAVANLAIMTTPQAGTSDDDILVRKASTGLIKYISQASISGGTGITNSAGVDEIPKSDGVNIIGSGVYSRSNGDLSLGTDALSGTVRLITASGTTNGADIVFKPATAGRYIVITREGQGEQNPYLVLGTSGDSDIQYHTITTFGDTGEAKAALQLTSAIAIFSNERLGIHGCAPAAATGSLTFSAALGLDFGVADHHIKGATGVGAGVDGKNLSICGGNAYQSTGNGNGGDVIIRSGIKRSAGSGVDGDTIIDALGGDVKLSGNSLTFNGAPISGGSGITNSAISNEIPKSDGDNVVSSGVFSFSGSTLTLGNTTSTGSSRLITTSGSSRPNLIIKPSRGLIPLNDGAFVTIQGGFGYGASGDSNGGDVNIVSGLRRITGSGLDGNINIDANNGDVNIDGTNILVNGAPIQGSDLDLETGSTAASTITLNMNNQKERMFVGSATFSTAKTMALSNVTGSLLFLFTFEVTNVAAELTAPADWLMASVDWDGTKWVPPATGKYEMGGSWNDTNWYIKMNGPFT